MKRTGIIILFLFILGLFNFRLFSDDKELFMGVNAGVSQVKPNVMFELDSSGSMGNIIYYPKLGLDGIAGTADDGFDQEHTYNNNGSDPWPGSGGWNIISSPRWFCRWVNSSGKALKYNSHTGVYGKNGEDELTIGSTGAAYLHVGDWITNKSGTAIAQIATISGTTVTLVNRSGTFPIAGFNSDDELVFNTYSHSGYVFRPVKLYGYAYYYFSTSTDNYFKWLFIYATDAQRAAVSYFCDYGTFDVTIPPDETPVNQISSCGSSHGNKKLWTRVQVLREVACQVADNSYKKVKMGMFRFNSGDGGRWIADIEDLEEASGTVKLQAFKDKAYSIPANGNTPLAETTGDIWRYFKPGSHDYHTDGWTAKDYKIVTSVFDTDTSPIEHWCQKNYIVLITDGVPTSDTFDNWRWSSNDSIFTEYSSHRTEEYSGWSSWSPSKGWGDTDWNGRPYIDDVAYFLNHQDMFPDNLYSDWPGDQNIFTFTIGFAIDNALLKETALNGGGAYYTATDYDALIDAFDNIITTILLRDFAFSAITAPKKTTTVASEELNMSYVGYFLPSTSTSKWEGHLIANELEERWGFDADDDGEISFDEQYDNKSDCLNNVPSDKTCKRFLNLSTTAKWDANLKMKNRSSNRNLFYYDGDGNSSTDIKQLSSLSNETETKLATLFGEATTQADATNIEDKLYEKEFADVFHSDISFIGKALPGKLYLKNINPKECLEGDNDECYMKFYNEHQSRREVVYVGTNDGILHMIDADPENGGDEIWGFVPDEAMPNIKKNVFGTVHNYTVDGRIKIEDIYYRNGNNKGWKSVLCFGLRRGGKAFYMLDVTEVEDKPKMLWKFKDTTYSGQSFSKPKIAQMRILNTEATPPVIENKWVVILTGGFEFNDENINDSRGKAIFIVDASTGDLLWMVGYNKDGAEDSGGTSYIDTLKVGGDEVRNLTKSPLFNYSIPTAISVIDKNNDGFSDGIYFGNKGGHLFKIDMSNPDPEYWKTYNLYQNTVTTLVTATITEVDNYNPERPKIKISATFPDSYEGYNIIAMHSSNTNYAAGNIIKITGNQLEIELKSDTGFQVDQDVYIKTWDPVYLAPTLAYDTCYKMWVAFGTGDRDRPRTNPNKGKLVALLENGNYYNTYDDLVDLANGATTSTVTEGGSDWDVVENGVSKSSNGFYYRFTDDREKIFDPEPLILPDKNFVPHIYFNTYQPPTTTTSSSDPCEAPDEGNMQFYDVAIAGCALNEFEIKLKHTGGRISGGGMLGGGEYVIYKGSGSVASVPPLESVDAVKLGYPGSVIFWKEKKR